MARMDLEHTYRAQFPNGSSAVLQAGAEGIRTLSCVVAAFACPEGGNVEAQVATNLDGNRSRGWFLMSDRGCRRAGIEGETVALVIQGHAISATCQADVGICFRLDARADTDGQRVDGQHVHVHGMATVAGCR